MMNFNKILDAPLTQVRIADFVRQHAKEHPEREAVVFGDRHISYVELEQRVKRCAKALLASGVGKGDRVAMLCTPRPEYWEIFLATTDIGAIWLGVNPKYRLDECRYIIADAKPELLFSLTAFEGQNYRPYIRALLGENSFLKSVITIASEKSPSMGYEDFLELANSVPERVYERAVQAVEPMDPAFLVYTSGSTGKPKGALLSHHGLCFGALVQNYHYSGEAEGREIAGASNVRTLCYFPINHVSCVADSCCVALAAGGTIHFQERFDPPQVLTAIAREKINMFGGTPTMLLMLADQADFDTTDFSSVEMVTWGGAAMPEPVAKRLLKITPNLINSYGMTETAANVTYTRYSDSLEQKCHSIGRPSPYMPCRIVNSAGKICGLREHGELQFKGDHLMRGYFNRPDATGEAFTKEGWLLTGDVGFWREDGNITLEGRLSDVFKSGGYNVYPREIEALLESHPAVELAAVVSMPDPLYQEVGAAFILPQKGRTITASELTIFCKERLANYKIPKRFTISAELPILPAGKIDKLALKRSVVEDFVL